MKKRSARRVSTLILAAYLQTATGNIIPDPAVVRPARLGIVALDVPAGVEDQRAYRMLEARLKRWIENHPQASVHAEEVTGESPAFQRAELAVQTDLLLKALSSTKSDKELTSRLYRELDRKLESSERYLAVGKELQAALVARSMYLWQNRNPLGSEGALRAALALHPEGALDVDFIWDWESREDTPTGFSDLLSRIETTSRRTCEISWDRFPKGYAIQVNGFATNAEKPIRLLPRVLYALQLRDQLSPSADANTYPTRRVICDKPGKIRVASSSLLEGEKTPSEVGSSVVVLPESGRFRLFLYSGTAPVEEISLVEPLSTKRLLAQRSDTDLPIASDALAQYIVQDSARQLSPLSISDNHSGLLPSAAALSADPHESQWYTEPGFWLVVGGLAAGFAVVYSLTRPSPAETSSHRMGIQIR